MILVISSLVKSVMMFLVCLIKKGLHKMRKIKTKEMVLCGLFVALITAGAFIQVPIPGLDYFTLQFFFVLMSGLILGAVLGGTAVLVYVLLGLVGVPVFAAGGGIMYVVRPSYGYLIGFVLAAVVTGWVAELTGAKTFMKYLLACLCGFIVCYAIGLIYKYFMLNLYVGEATPFWIVLLDCFPIDMPGDLVLCVISSMLAVRLKPVYKKIIAASGEMHTLKD